MLPGGAGRGRLEEGEARGGGGTYPPPQLRIDPTVGCSLGDSLLGWSQAAHGATIPASNTQPLYSLNID